LNYAGLVIVFALILGGGTEQALWSDYLLQILMLPIVIAGIVKIPDNRLGRVSGLLVVLIIFVLVIQFIPFQPDRNIPTLTQFTSSWGFWSLTPAKSMEAALFAVSILGFSLFVTCMDDYQQQRLIRFLMLGFVINVLVGVIQLSYASRSGIDGILPFQISVGLFANENHFSSLIYMMIPLIAWRFLAASWKPISYVLITILIVALLFAVGSRAGMVISSALALFCLAWFTVKNVPHKIKRAGFVMIAVIALIGIFFMDTTAILEGDYRETVFLRTWQAIVENFWVGTGLGSFVLVFPMFEQREDIIAVYANHAHNDYLELLLELGIVFIPLLFLYLIQIARGAFRSKLAQAATLSLLAVLVHSVVDYPLRTMAIAIVFGTLSAIILSTKENQSSSRGRLRNRVEE